MCGLQKRSLSDMVLGRNFSSLRISIVNESAANAWKRVVR